MKLRVGFFCLLIILLTTSSVFAETQNFYQFQTAQQEQRFEFLTKQFRCLVCQNESLAESNALLAQDLRQQIYQMVNRGFSDVEIKNYLVERYSDYILFSPPFNQKTILLWLSPLILFIIGITIMVLMIRQGEKQ